MGVRALELILAICKKRFEVIVSSWDTIDEIFEDKCESVYQGQSAN